ncbi:MAG: Flp pilus assembly protein CpaB, partial [Haliea sp.]
MRRTTIYSFLIAAVLAVLAVFGVQAWLTSERQNILKQVMENTDKPAASTMVVVASKPLRFGERVTSSKLKLIEWPGESIPAGAFEDLELVVGQDEQTARYVLSAIEIDEPVLKSKITIPGQKAKLSTALRAGMKAVSIRVNDV